MTETPITLDRDGDVPIRFCGTMLGEASSHHYSGPRSSRWTEVTIYRTEGNVLVAWVRGRTCWEGEVERNSVVTADTPNALVEALRDEDGYLGGVSCEALANAGLDVTEEIA